MAGVCEGPDSALGNLQPRYANVMLTEAASRRVDGAGRGSGLGGECWLRDAWGSYGISVSVERVRRGFSWICDL